MVSVNFSGSLLFIVLSLYSDYANCQDIDTEQCRKVIVGINEDSPDRGTTKICLGDFESTGFDCTDNLGAVSIESGTINQIFGLVIDLHKEILVI